MPDQDFMGLNEIAQLAGVTVSAVSNWRTRSTDFPRPIKELSSGPVFSKVQVQDWLRSRSGKVPVTISLFNNKGGVGKTTTLWNLAVSLSAKGKSVLVIDFDPQCNFSIACLGANKFAKCLEQSTELPYGRTIRSFTLPYIQQSRSGKIFLEEPTYKKSGKLDVIPGDFWLNTFSDVLNVGTDVIGGSGLYRFLTPAMIIDGIQEQHKKTYEYVLIDLPPSFNSLVRSALYSSDYFIVPCTADLFSAYCVGLIGEVLPSFLRDWDQGVERYLASNTFDEAIKRRGKPKFGGWVFNGFDTRKPRDSKDKKKLGADEAQFKIVKESIDKKLMLHLSSRVKTYEIVPTFASAVPLAEIEDLNVMAPDSIVQNIPIKYLKDSKPTRESYNRANWAKNQIKLMDNMDAEYDKLASSVIEHFT